jgi:hypothetical protein
LISGAVFHDEIRRLVPYAPWRWDIGPRRLTPRSLFRVGFLVLVGVSAHLTYKHHFHVGPELVWKCSGNPFLQPDVEQNRVPPPQLKNDWRQSVPKADDEQHEQYRNQCVWPYKMYFPYSMVNFVVILPVVLTVGVYSLIAAIRLHYQLQPAWMAELCQSSRLQAQLVNRFRYYRSTIFQSLERFFVFLLILLIALWYGMWFDRYNLTITAAKEYLVAMGMVFGVWCASFLTLWLAYRRLRRMTADNLAEVNRTEFIRRHTDRQFFAESVRRSEYWPVAAFLLVTGYPLWLVVSGIWGWDR